MTSGALLGKLEEIMELEAGSLRGDEKLDELDAWDSLRLLEFLAFADQELSLQIPPGAVGSCSRVDDLVQLALGKGH